MTVILLSVLNDVRATDLNMGLLDKTNPYATRESVRRHAIIGGVIGMTVCMASLLWTMPAEPNWLLVPGAGILCAAIAALVEWQLDDSIDLYEVLLELDDEFRLELPKDTELVTVGDMFQLILATRRLKKECSVDEEDTWDRLKKLLVKQVGIKPEQVTPEARFYIDIRM